MERDGADGDARMGGATNAPATDHAVLRPGCSGTTLGCAPAQRAHGAQERDRKLGRRGTAPRRAGSIGALGGEVSRGSSDRRRRAVQQR